MIIRFRLPCVLIDPDIRHKGKSQLLRKIALVVAVRQLPFKALRNLLHNHIGPIGKQNGAPVIVIRSILLIALQGKGIPVRSAACRPIPGNGQALLQPVKHGKVSLRLAGCPLQCPVIGLIAVKVRLCGQNFLLIRLHIQMVSCKLLQHLLRIALPGLLRRPVHSVKKLLVIIGSILLCLQKAPAAAFRRPEDRLNRLGKCLPADVLRDNLPFAVHIDIFQIAL